MTPVHEQNSRANSTILSRNALLIVGSTLLTKSGDALANPKTVLTWMLGSVGAPESLIGMLVPIREAGSMLPQAYFAQWIRKFRYRKGVWIFGSIAQGMAILGIGATGYFLEGTAAGLLILLLLAAFSLARSLCSITSKDVLGKTIPKSTRGRVTGVSTSLSNLLVMGVGVYLIAIQQGTNGDSTFSLLVCSAGVCWLLAAVVYRRIQEPPGEIEDDLESRSFVLRLKNLWRDQSFVRFMFARGFLLASALSAPYYVRIVQDTTEGDLQWLGVFIVAQGLAVGLSGYFWGKLADRSSRSSMVLGGILTAILGLSTGGFEIIAPNHSLLPWIGVGGFFLLGIAHNGVRIGRKTYVVNLGEGNKRTEYVSVSNTVIGTLLLVTGSLGALSTFLSPGGILAIMASFALVGSLLAFTLPELESE